MTTAINCWLITWIQHHPIYYSAYEGCKWWLLYQVKGSYSNCQVGTYCQYYYSGKWYELDRKIFSLFDIVVTHSIISVSPWRQCAKISFISVVLFQLVGRLTVRGSFRPSPVRRSVLISMILTLITPILDKVLINWESTSATLVMCTSSLRKSGIQWQHAPKE